MSEKERQKRIRWGLHSLWPWALWKASVTRSLLGSTGTVTSALLECEIHENTSIKSQRAPNPSPAVSSPLEMSHKYWWVIDFFLSAESFRRMGRHTLTECLWNPGTAQHKACISIALTMKLSSSTYDQYPSRQFFIHSFYSLERKLSRLTS